MIQLMEGFDGLTNMRDLYQSNHLLPYVAGGGTPLVPGPPIMGESGQSAVVAFNSLSGSSPGVNGPTTSFKLPKNVKELWDSGGVSMGARIQFNDATRLYPGMSTAGPSNVNFSQIATDTDDDVFCLFHASTATPKIALRRSIDGCRTWTDVALPAGWAFNPIYTSIWCDADILFLSAYSTGGPLYWSSDKGATWTRTASPTSLINQVTHSIRTGDPVYPWMIVCNSTYNWMTTLYIGTGLGPTDTWTAVSTPGAGGLVTTEASSAWGRLCKIGARIMVGCANGMVVSFNTALPLGNAAGITVASSMSLFVFQGIGDSPFVTDIVVDGGFIWVAGARSIGTGTQYPCTMIAPMPDPNVVPSGGYIAVNFNSPVFSLAACKGVAMLSVGYAVRSQFRDVMSTETLINYGVTYQVVATSKKIYELRTTSPTDIFCGSIVELDPETGQRTIVTVSKCGEATSNGLVNGLGFVCPLAITGTSSLTYEAAANNNQVMLSFGAINQGQRLMTLNCNAGTGMVAVASYLIADAVSNPKRYVEVTLRADDQFPNQFYATVRLDGDVVIRTEVSYKLGLPAYTTNPVFVNLPSDGVIQAFDDLYATDYSGSNNVGNLGVCTVAAKVLEEDVEAEWGAPIDNDSHAALIGGTRSPTYNTTGIQALGAPTTDVYATSALNVSTTNVRIAAVRTEVWAERLSADAPEIQFGLRNVDGEVMSNVVINTQLQCSSGVFEADATGAPWTPASVDAAEVVLTKV